MPTLPQTSHRLYFDGLWYGWSRYLLGACRVLSGALQPYPWRVLVTRSIVTRFASAAVVALKACFVPCLREASLAPRDPCIAAANRQRTLWQYLDCILVWWRCVVDTWPSGCGDWDCGGLAMSSGFVAIGRVAGAAGYVVEWCCSLQLQSVLDGLCVSWHGCCAGVRIPIWFGWLRP